jgi:hypothetical protein
MVQVSLVPLMVQASLVTKKAKAKLSSIEDQLEDDMVQAT